LARAHLDFNRHTVNRHTVNYHMVNRQTAKGPEIAHLGSRPPGIRWIETIQALVPDPKSQPVIGSP
jgi:hypothetical protein